MHKKLRNCMIFGILFTTIAGTLMHFAYEWSNQAFLIGLIAPVNESTWEHMKLLFFPMLLFSIFCISRQKKKEPCICSGLLGGLLLGTFLIPVLFYTYTGLLGFHVLWMDIAVFILSVLLAFIAAYYLTISCCLKKYTPVLLFFTVVLMFCFFFFTSYPPDIGLFQIP